jgi:hypothetical protein
MGRWLGCLSLTIALTACGLRAWTEIPPGCSQTLDFTFAGEASLADLGLSGDSRWGFVWVTAGPVSSSWRPGGVGMPPLPPERLACARYSDGSGTVIGVPDDWQLGG